MNILLVEDNHDLALNVTEFFEKKGHIIDYAADGLSALNLVLKQSYEVIILDVMLPGMSGLTFCQQLRENYELDMPVIMLTAKDTEADKLKGFQAGTDDYLVKPFSLPELEARLQSLIRRSKNQSFGKKKLIVEDLEYSPDTMKLKRGDTELSLKPIPLKILIILMQNSDRVVTRQEIEQQVWNDAPPDSEVLRSHIYAIRSEVDKNGSKKLVQTIRGVGYRLAIDER
jgi:DNA-binding response OmpR family regulator